MGQTQGGAVFLGDLVTLMPFYRFLVLHFMLEDVKLSYLSTSSLCVLLFKIFRECELALSKGVQF